MAVKVITDSGSDISAELAQSLDISIVPINVIFGTDEYKDGVDLLADEFYRRLIGGPVHPTTSQPSPGDFVQVYDNVDPDADGIVSVHLSSKLSGTYNSAVQAKAETKFPGPIEIVDSYQAAMALGVVAIATANAAQGGAGFEEVVEAARSAVPRARLLFMLDTLDYLVKGGRIGKARALVGTLLKIKPMITVMDGEVHDLGRARSLAKAVAKLKDEARALGPLELACALHTTTPEIAGQLADDLKPLLSGERDPWVAQSGPTIGTYAGPGALGIGLLQVE
jgi:DegV family protein with EDD domain